MNKHFTKPQASAHDRAATTKVGWWGPYINWTAAEAEATGYHHQAIIDKVFNSAYQVKKGEAAYERDSVLFDKVQHNWPAISCLLNAVLEKGQDRLRVLDVGGALGTTFFAIRSYIPKHIYLQWTIVDQPAFVQLGQQYFATEALSFLPSVADAFATEPAIDLVLLSGVLQYLPRPTEFLDNLLSHPFRSLLIDRTSFIDSGPDRIMVQHVPPSIYPASYPCWTFNETAFRKGFEDRGLTIRAAFQSQFDGAETTTDKRTIYFKGFYVKRND